jgi:hypothetical protein
MRRLIWVIGAAVLAAFAVPLGAQPRFTIIDMHFHAERPDAEGPPGGKVCAPYASWSPRDPGKPIDAYLDWFTGHPTCQLVLTAPTDANDLRDRGIAMLTRFNMLVLAGGAAATVEDFRSHAPDHILPAAGFGQADDFPSIAELRALHAAGKLTALSEITAQYAGIAGRSKAGAVFCAGGGTRHPHRHSPRVCLHLGDSLGRESLTHERSALRRAGRCVVTPFEMISGTGSRTFCLGVKVTLAARPRTIGSLSRRCSTVTAVAAPGGICPSDLVAGQRSGNASIVGRRAVFLNVSSTCWPLTTTMST